MAALEGTSRKAWIYCPQCNEAELLRSSGPDLLPAAERQEALVEFLERHAGHTVTQLVPVPLGAYLYSGPLWAPETTIWIEVTDGRETFVLEGSRERLGEPRRYRRRRGFQLRPVTILWLDPARALQAWTRTFTALAAPRFGEQLVIEAQRLLRETDPATIEPEFDDGEDPTLSFAGWPPSLRETLMSYGETLLPRATHRQWTRFVTEECQAHGAWAIHVIAGAQLREHERQLSAPL
ncbi:MAG: hypothetical protein KatS3mg077_1051 [Candidatus Binatia bacterium]|nr:MAG: hypothetical protein KatS3mg077_1051 [Candidatus Binatia bacterium]